MSILITCEEKIMKCSKNGRLGNQYFNRTKSRQES